MIGCDAVPSCGKPGCEDCAADAACLAGDCPLCRMGEHDLTDAPDFSLPARLWQPGTFMLGALAGALAVSLFAGAGLYRAERVIVAQSAVIQGLLSEQARVAVTRAEAERMLQQQIDERNRGCE